MRQNVFREGMLWGLILLTIYAQSVQTTREGVNNNEIHNILMRLNRIANVTIKPHPTETCRKIRYRTDISKGYNGCYKKMITQTFCAGQCSSLLFPNKNFLTAGCSSCSVTKKRIRNVKLYCITGVRKVRVPIAEKCGCTSCRIMTNSIPDPPWKSRSKRFQQRKEEKVMKIALRRLRKNSKSVEKKNESDMEKLRRKLKKRRRRKNKRKNRMKNQTKKSRKNKKKNKKKEKKKQQPPKKQNNNPKVKTTTKALTFRDMTQLLFSFSNHKT
ncbi:uncharacterized protein [Clytia hemisphaerica]|uniref:CTCK domain-containing protein n=1 Tax=Clytia hemisphaerica TaxID=252671 RepID=A0A7M5X853_9CNID